MKEYLPELNVFEKIIAYTLKRYTYKVYKKGFVDGYNWSKSK